jgi:hypothetical protein
LGSKLAIGAGVGACLTVIQALLAITYLHFLAFDVGFSIRMIFALHTGTSVGFSHNPPRLYDQGKKR